VLPSGGRPRMPGCIPRWGDALLPRRIPFRRCRWSRCGSASGLCPAWSNCSRRLLRCRWRAACRSSASSGGFLGVASIGSRGCLEFASPVGRQRSLKEP
jgi:hypothetical protein